MIPKEKEDGLFWLHECARTNGPQKFFELFESFSEDKNNGIISVITVAELSAGASSASTQGTPGF